MLFIFPDRDILVAASSTLAKYERIHYREKRERGWSTYMFHRIVRRGVLVFFAYSLKDYESVAADVEPRTC